MRLKGKVAIVTGASRGIGRAIAACFAREGAALVLVARGQRGLRDVAAEATALGAEVVAVQADVAHPPAVATMARRALARFKKIDLLVNNAGIGTFAPFLKLRIPDWDRLMAVNLRGPFLCTRAVLPSMIRRRQGCIINIASVAALRGFADCSAYSASKGGLLGFSRALAAEVRPYDIRVMVICPGAVDTPLWDGLGNFDRGRMLRGEDVADAALWLASRPDRVNVEAMVIGHVSGDL